MFNKHNTNFTGRWKKWNRRDLQRNNYFINLGESNKFSDHNTIDNFCDFFQQHGRFPGSQDLIVVLKPEITYILKLTK